MKIKVLIALIILVTGTLSGTALIYSALWPVVFVTLIPLFLVCLREKSASSWTVFSCGLLFGIGLMGASLSYGFAMLPLTWIGVSSPAIGFFIMFFAWTFHILLLSIPVGLFALAFRSGGRLPTWFTIFAAPLLWVVGEILRATFYTAVTYGPGATIGPFFTFGFLGYTLAGADGLLFLARWGGVFALSFFIAAVNTGLTLFIHYKKIRLHYALIYCAGVVIFIWGLSAALPSYQKVSVGAAGGIVKGEKILLVHTDEDSRYVMSEKETEEKRIALAVNITQRLSDMPDANIVVLPEDSRFLETIASAVSLQEKQAIKDLLQRKVLLIDSSRLEQRAHVRGALYAYDFASNTPKLFSSKTYLAPFGEYVPYVLSVSAKVLGFGSNIGNLSRGRSAYIPGTWNPQDRIVKWHDVSYGLLSCSELFNPFLARDLSQRGVDAIVLVSSQSWIPQNSPLLFNQMLGMAKVTAAWAGKPYLQATNKAPNIAIEILRYN